MTDQTVYSPAAIATASVEQITENMDLLSVKDSITDIEEVSDENNDEEHANIVANSLNTAAVSATNDDVSFITVETGETSTNPEPLTAATEVSIDVDDVKQNDAIKTDEDQKEPKADSNDNNFSDLENKPKKKYYKKRNYKKNYSKSKKNMKLVTKYDEQLISEPCKLDIETTEKVSATSKQAVDKSVDNKPKKKFNKRKNSYYYNKNRQMMNMNMNMMYGGNGIPILIHGEFGGPKPINSVGNTHNSNDATDINNSSEKATTYKNARPSMIPIVYGTPLTYRANQGYRDNTKNFNGNINPNNKMNNFQWSCLTPMDLPKINYKTKKPYKWNNYYGRNPFPKNQPNSKNYNKENKDEGEINKEINKNGKESIKESIPKSNIETVIQDENSTLIVE